MRLNKRKVNLLLRKIHFSNGHYIANIFKAKPLKPLSKKRGLKTLDSATDCFFVMFLRRFDQRKV